MIFQYFLILHYSHFPHKHQTLHNTKISIKLNFTPQKVKSMHFIAQFVPSHFHQRLHMFKCNKGKTSKLLQKNMVFFQLSLQFFDFINSFIVHILQSLHLLNLFFRHLVFPIQFVDYRLSPTTHLRIILQKVITTSPLQPNKTNKYRNNYHSIHISLIYLIWLYIHGCNYSSCILRSKKGMGTEYWSRKMG